MKPCQPKELIEAFDRCLIFFYGQSYARENPHKSDAETAKKWADAGCDIILATLVFGERMAMMHERFLRNIDRNDRRNVPAVLSIFEENIYGALRRDGIGGVIDRWEQNESQWRARLMAFHRSDLWNEDMWGPKPGAPGCRVPKALL